MLMQLTIAIVSYLVLSFLFAVFVGKFIAVGEEN